jgi:para-nitrobenzyl esterase
MAFLASVPYAQTLKPVHTEAGLVLGTTEGGLTVYKGVPFAAPPLGELRWQPPKGPIAWTGTRNADKFAPACVQMPLVMRDLGMDAMETNEDCLYLNIWTPTKSPNDRLPCAVAADPPGAGEQEENRLFGGQHGAVPKP